MQHALQRYIGGNAYLFESKLSHIQPGAGFPISEVIH